LYETIRGVYLLMDIFGTISSAENKAAAILQNAAREAAEILDRAARDGEAAVAAAKANANAEAAELIASARAASAVSAEDLARTTENRKAILRSRVEKKIPEAVSFIVDSVVNG
jgi:vacuolar-type H+-ATPase subunit H